MKVNRTKKLTLVVASIIVMTLGFSCNSHSSNGSSNLAAAASSDLAKAGMIENDCKDVLELFNTPTAAERPAFVVECTIGYAHGNLATATSTNSIRALTMAEATLCAKNMEIRSFNYTCKYLPIAQH